MHNDWLVIRGGRRFGLAAVCHLSNVWVCGATRQAVVVAAVAAAAAAAAAAAVSGGLQTNVKELEERTMDKVVLGLEAFR